MVYLRDLVDDLETHGVPCTFKNDTLTIFTEGITDEEKAAAERLLEACRMLWQGIDFKLEEEITK